MTIVLSLKTHDTVLHASGRQEAWHNPGWLEPVSQGQEDSGPKDDHQWTADSSPLDRGGSRACPPTPAKNQEWQEDETTEEAGNQDQTNNKQPQPRPAVPHK